MAGVREAVRRLKKVRDNLEPIAESSISEVAPDFVEAQKAQLEQGNNSEGGSFRKYRNAVYAKEKNLMNPLPGYGNPDLKYSGNFYRGIKATVQGGKIVVESTDEKAQMLESNYAFIFGLNPQEMEDFLYGKLKPVFHKNILNALK
jgi:hypothetical protein